jgi:hypothetical protein
MKFMRQVSLTRLLIPAAPARLAGAPKRRKEIQMRLALFAAAFMALTSVMRADDYERDSDGDFTDGQWINRTQTPPGAQPIRGNPGGGDAAAFGMAPPP